MYPAISTKTSLIKNYQKLMRLYFIYLNLLIPLRLIGIISILLIWTRKQQNKRFWQLWFKKSHGSWSDIWDGGLEVLTAF